MLFQDYKAQNQIELSSAAGEQLRTQIEELKIQISTFEAKNEELLNDKVSSVKILLADNYLFITGKCVMSSM